MLSELWRRGRQIASRHRACEALALVGAIAKRRVGRMPAATKGDSCATAQPEDLALLIGDLKIPLDTKRSVAEDGYFGTCHEILR
jgi:hypothetical protein